MFEPDQHSLRSLELWLPVPGQHLIELPHQVLGNARKDSGQPRLRIDIVQPGGLEQRVVDGRALPAACTPYSTSSTMIVPPRSMPRWAWVAAGMPMKLVLPLATISPRLKKLASSDQLGSAKCHRSNCGPNVPTLSFDQEEEKRNL